MRITLELGMSKYFCSLPTNARRDWRLFETTEYRVLSLAAITYWSADNGDRAFDAGLVVVFAETNSIR